MFGFKHALPSAKFDLLNPICGPIFHLELDRLMDQPGHSQTTFRNTTVVNHLEEAFRATKLQRRRSVDNESVLREFSRIAVNGLLDAQRLARENNHDKFAKYEENFGILSSIISIRNLTFAVAPALESHPMRVCEITKQTLWFLSGGLAAWTSGSFLNAAGRQCARFGMQFDLLSRPKLAEEEASKIVEAWHRFYEQPNKAATAA